MRPTNKITTYSPITHLQCRTDILRNGFFGTDDRMTTELMLQLSTLMPVDPAEDPRVVLWCRTVRYPMGPVLRETVLPSGGLQPGRAQAQLHQHVRFAVLSIVPPERGQRLLHTTFTCKERRKKNKTPISVSERCCRNNCGVIAGDKSKLHKSNHSERLCHSSRALLRIQERRAPFFRSANLSSISTLDYVVSFLFINFLKSFLNPRLLNPHPLNNQNYPFVVVAATRLSSVSVIDTKPCYLFPTLARSRNRPNMMQSGGVCTEPNTYLFHPSNQPQRWTSKSKPSVVSRQSPRFSLHTKI